MTKNISLAERIRQAKSEDPSLSVRAICRNFKVHHSTVERILADQPSPESSEMVGDTWTLTLPQTNIHTLEQLVEYAKIDLNLWNVDRFVVNKWEVAAKDNSGHLHSKPLFQVKAFLSKKKHIEEARQEIDELKKLAKSSASRPLPVKKLNNGNLMLEINIPDAHLGKLAHTVETRGANYDTKVAEHEYDTAFRTLLARASKYKYDEIVYVVGNDLLQSDDPEGRTTKGTYVSTDGRFYKTFKVARTMIVKHIETLRQYARIVRVIVVPGNHDSRSCFHLGDSLECYFHNYSDVVVDNEPVARKYLLFGKVLLGFTHGHTGKHSDYPMLMASEVPELFGLSKFREMHCGHRHKTQSDLTRVREIDESHGVRVRILSALTATDAWHSQSGFVGNLRGAEAFVWDAESGLVANYHYNNPEF